MLTVEETIRGNHNLIVENRKKITLTGVKEVLSFDEETILLDTFLGGLTVKGSGMSILGFERDTGDLIAEGQIFAFAYTAEVRGGFFSRLFR